MASLTPELMKILDELIPKIEQEKDFYLSIFISWQGVNINIYPYVDDGGDDNDNHMGNRICTNDNGRNQ